MTGTVSGRRAAAGLALVLLAVVAIVFPVVFSSPVVTNYAVYALIFVAVVTAWNMFSGFSGASGVSGTAGVVACAAA